MQLILIHCETPWIMDHVLCQTKYYYYYRTTGLPSNTCVFMDDKVDAGVRASFMFYHYINGVSVDCMLSVVQATSINWKTCSCNSSFI